MKIKKGDKVLFEVRDKPLDLQIGIVMSLQEHYPFVDLLCKGEGMDYRCLIDKIRKNYGNVFE